MIRKIIVIYMSLCCLQTVFASESASDVRRRRYYEECEQVAADHRKLAETISGGSQYSLRHLSDEQGRYTVFTGDAFGAVTGRLVLPGGHVVPKIGVPGLDDIIREEHDAGDRILSVSRWLLSRVYKIHLMPSKKDFVPLLSCLLTQAARDRSFAQLVRAIKATNTPNYLFMDVDHDERGIIQQLVMPMIVLYPAPPVCTVYPEAESVSNAQLLLRKLVDLTSPFHAITRHEVTEKEVSCRRFPCWQAADGSIHQEFVTPRFNVPYTDLIFYAQANADEKMDPAMRRNWFDPRFNSALFNQHLLGLFGPTAEGYLLAGSPFGKLTLTEETLW